MGLSGARVKQRIADDPRNTRWANDTSAPGYKLLSSMGWTPADASLGLASSQELIAATGAGFSKKIAAIPIAKDDNAGIGARKPGAAAGLGSLRMMGLPSAGMGMGFVKASEKKPEEVMEDEKNAGAKKSGGEFGRLLERLNAAAAAQSSASSSEEEDEIKTPAVTTVVVTETSTTPAFMASVSTTPALLDTPTDSGASTPTLLKNPRMAARSKHLRAKRMASSSNSAAMAEILGIAPPLSSLPTIPPRPTPPPLPVSPPTTEGWPVVPARSFGSTSTTATPSAAIGSGISSMFAPSSSGALASTFAPSSTGALSSTFAPSSSGALQATFELETTATSALVEETVVPVEGETEKQREKREKKARKEAKRKGKLAVVESESVAEAKEEVVAEVVQPRATMASMFVSSSSTSLAATFEEPSSVAAEAIPVEVEETKKEKKKKDKGEKKKSKRAREEDVEESAPAVETAAVSESVEAVVDEDAERKERKRAKKEKKRLEKELAGESS